MQPRFPFREVPFIGFRYFQVVMSLSLEGLEQVVSLKTTTKDPSKRDTHILPNK